MLYLSTRSATDCYTAHRALNEARTPDGGMYVPFRMSVLTAEELQQIKAGSTCEAIADILNLFFGLHLTGWDVECVVGRYPLKPVTVNQRLVVAEGWRNPEGSFAYLLTGLYRRMTGKNDVAFPPSGWAHIAIVIALLFGLYAAVEEVPEQGLDIAVTAGDFADLAAIAFAKQMGLPVNTIICTCNENSVSWDLFTKGDFNTNTTPVSTALSKLDVVRPEYLECFIFARLGMEDAKRYLDDCENKRIYRVDENRLPVLNQDVFCTVVSTSRVESILNGMQRANGYAIDPYTALAYGGLQDYRANTGANRDTLILAKYRPATEKE